MPSRAPVSSKHLFVSSSGKALSRWVQAFPKATLARPKDLRKRSVLLEQAEIIWLHLDPALPSVTQLTELRKKIGTIPVVILASSPDNDDALNLFSSGARGYCNAHATAANLKQIASVVLGGGLWIGEALMQRLLVATTGALAQVTVGAAPSVNSALRTLTAREQEVAKAVASGSNNKEIARALGITERTIKAHASAIFQKLGARDRLHLALIVNGHRTA